MLTPPPIGQRNSPISVPDVRSRAFCFGRMDGSVVAQTLILQEDGSFGAYRHHNENSWAVENGCLVFKDIDGTVTTRFEMHSWHDGGHSFSGPFLPHGPDIWHTLTEIPTNRRGIIAELIEQLYVGNSPFDGCNPNYEDHGYPHTNLRRDLVASVLDVVRPEFWLEVGSMLGGSAILAADVMQEKVSPTEVVCIDPFTGDVNMWDWERGKRVSGEWAFLRLERGRPTIYDRFLANVVAANHRDRILPIQATSIVGLKLLRRLREQFRISSLPTVIYLDSAHEPDETFLELRQCWSLLESGGVLMGDDWDWDAVRNDVTRFSETVELNRDGTDRIAARHGRFRNSGRVLLDDGQWLLVK